MLCHVTAPHLDEMGLNLQVCARAAGFGEHRAARRTDRLLLEMGGA